MKESEKIEETPQKMEEAIDCREKGLFFFLLETERARNCKGTSR